MDLRKYNGGMHLLATALAACLFGGFTHAAPPSSSGDPIGGAPDGNRLVSMTLISDFSAVEPGQEATLAVRYRIEKDWHLYWRNPGETGLPPNVEFSAPDWLTIGEAVWPAPERHEMPGRIVDFIYETEVVVMYPVRIAADASIGASATIRATGDWLVCRRECLFGGGESALEIAVASHPTRSSAAREIGAWRAKVPKRLDEVRDPPVQVDWRGATLVIEAPGAERITMFPFNAADDDAMPRDILRDGEVDGDRLEVAYNGDDLRTPATARGVVTIERGGETSSWEFELATTRMRKDSSD